MKKNENSKTVTREELSRRSKESKLKADLINITLPKGTKDILIELTGKRPATACRDIIIKYIEEIEKKEKEKN